MKCYLADTSDCDSTPFFEVDDFTIAERRLLQLRSRITPLPNSRICTGHRNKLLIVYSTYHKSCLEPFRPHSKKVVKNHLRRVTLNYYDKYFDGLKWQLLQERNYASTAYPN